MGPIAGTVATASAMFAATNVDDAVVLTVLNASSAGGGAPKRWQIWAGQYVGIGLIVVVSLLAAVGLSFLPVEWVGLLGLIPLARGMALLAKEFRRAAGGDDDVRPLAIGLLSVITVTFANGGDNISVYTPAFRIMGPADTALTIAIFGMGTAVWCLGGALLVSHRRLVERLQQYSRWIVPVVLIALGVYVVVRSGLLHRIF